MKGYVVKLFAKHDPDEYKVIADSFDEYLQNLIDNEFIYLNDKE